MKCFKLVDLFVFPDEPFCCLAWNFAEKIFWGSHPGCIFGAIYYPSLPFTIFISTLIFLYSALFQFVTILKRSFYHWDGLKNYLQKNSKNRICYYRRVNTAGGHTISQTHPIIPLILHHPLSIPIILSDFNLDRKSCISILHDFKQEYKIKLQRYVTGSPCSIEFIIPKTCYKTYEKTWQKVGKKSPKFCNIKYFL